MFTLDMLNTLSQPERAEVLRGLGISYVDVSGNPRDVVIASAADGLKGYKAGMDSIPNLSTVPNAGTVGYKLLAESPEVVNVLFTPLRSTEIAGEVKLGAFADNSAIVHVKEHTGTTTVYGDYAAGGTTGVNTGREERDYFRFQTWSEIAVLEEEQYTKQGASLFNLRSDKDVSAAYVVARQFNAINLKGVSGLNTRGLANDIDLLPAIMATAVWSGMTPDLINNEFVKISTQLIVQSGGLLTGNEPACFALPPAMLNAMKATNQYGLSAFTKVRENWPALRFVAIPEYGTLGSGNTTFCQWIVDKIDNVNTVEFLYTEKFRVFPLEQYSSYARKKVAAASGGALIKRPFGIVGYYGG